MKTTTETLTTELLTTENIVKKLGDSFKFDDFRLALNENNFPDISRLEAEMILEKLIRNYSSYPAKIKSKLQREFMEIELGEFLEFLLENHNPSFNHVVITPTKCRENYALICKTLARYIEQILFKISEKNPNTNDQYSQRTKFELNVKLSTYLVIMKALSSHKIHSMSEPRIGQFLEDNCTQKNGKRITENSVTTIFSKGIGEKSHLEAKDILLKIADSL